MKILTTRKSPIRWLVPLATVALCASLGAAPPAPGAQGARMSKHAEQGVTCAQCHGKGAKKEGVPMRRCTGCHGDTKDLAARTAAVKPTNPHENRHFGTEADCNRCHHEHAKSENLCLPCHQRFGFKVP